MKYEIYMMSCPCLVLKSIQNDGYTVAGPDKGIHLDSKDEAYEVRRVIPGSQDNENFWGIRPTHKPK